MRSDEALKTYMVRISVKDELPEKDGTYFVYSAIESEKGLFGRTYRSERMLACNFAEDNWSCNNQIVTHWLKEIKK